MRLSGASELSPEFVVATFGTFSYLAAALSAVLSLLGVRKQGERGSLGLLALGAVTLGGLLAARAVHAASIPSLSRFEALTGYTVALTAAYLVMMAVRPVRGVSGLLAPYACAVLLYGLPAFSAASGPPPPVQGFWLAAHIALAYAGYALLSLAGVLAAAYLVQDSNLKHKRLGQVWERFPALETLDHLMGRQVGTGFVLLTGSILLGITLVRRSGGGDEWLTDPKIGATAVTWIVFAVLVHMRASAGRHGRRMAVVTIAGLACLLFTFVGVHIVADSVHGFVRVLPVY
jgi:ABC-type uncharacterized transport system permease subunit